MDDEAPMRERLRLALAAMPGTSTRALAEDLGLSESTAAYHLRRLVRRGEARSQLVGRDRCWYASDCGLCPILKRAVPRLRRAPVAAVARVLGETPLTSTDIAQQTGQDRGAARWAAAELERAFLVERTSGGRVHVRDGAALCMAKGLAGEPCGLWGACPVSQAWRESLRLQTGRMGKGK